jgi:Tol biopolymer transport system component
VSLASGTRIGPYEVTGFIGAGGMGEVYRAHDTRLGRAVAIKLLPSAFADDPDRLRRFEQEARATAALNHPSILAIYDVGVHDGSSYLVTELLEGQSLRDRLAGGALPVPAAIDFGRQLAEGLAVAHDHGITHRDLKPENVFVLPGERIKILDFGLAKLAGSPIGGGSGSAAETRQETLPHTILGTLAYMAPEQARGEPADHRTDIFAFGCVLYEMLEGKALYAGGTPADTISAILKDPPAVPTSTPERPLPPAVQRIVHRCLEKDPAARFQSARDLAFVLNSLSGVEGIPSATSPEGPRTTATATATAAGARSRWVTAGRLAAGIAALAVTGAIGFVAARSTAPSALLPAMEFLLVPGGDDTFASMDLPGLEATAPQVGVSPDSRSIALVLTAPDGRRFLGIRALDAGLPRAIAGTDGVSSWPFWSPDGRTVVVAIDQTLQKVDAATGRLERLCSLPREAPPTPFVTGSWQDGDTILFSVGAAGIYKVAAEGGKPEAVTTLDTTRRDEYHSWPQLLPDGRFLVFVRTGDARTTGTYAGRLGSRDLALVLANASRAVYALGHLLWVSDHRLLAQPIDATSLHPSGQAATIVPSVYEGAGRTAAFWASGSGMLVYAPGGSNERHFRWFGRDGTVHGDVGPPGLYVTFDLTPDGTRVVTEIARTGEPARSTLSMLDTVRGVLTPLTTGEQNDSDPRFGPGGQVLFARNSGAAPGILRSDPAGGRLETVFPRGTLNVVWMEAWSRDGAHVVFRSGGSRDAMLSSGRGEPQPVTHSPANVEQVQFSPDGRWIAYNSAESGRSEVYVSPVPFDGKRWQLSSAGGAQPTWKADGREVYYLSPEGSLNAVEIRAAADRVDASPPRRLFRTTLPVISTVIEQYRPTADGQRFLFCLPVTAVRTEPLRVLLNWPAKLSPRG